MTEPLKMTFVADPPSDMSVLLINILHRQCEVNEETKQAVLLACEFITKKHGEKS